MHLISYKPKTIFSGPIYNFLMTGLGFEVMPNWASHTHLAGQNREKTRRQSRSQWLSYCYAVPHVQYNDSPQGYNTNENFFLK